MLFSDAANIEAHDQTMPAALSLSHCLVAGRLGGVDVIGLLATACGKVTEVGSGRFWLDDGSGLTTDTGSTSLPRAFSFPRACSKTLSPS